MVHDNSVSSRNLLDKLKLTEYLNTPGVTEVFINRPGEVFLEVADGCRRIERPDLPLPVLENWQIRYVLTIKSISHTNPPFIR